MIGERDQVSAERVDEDKDEITPTGYLNIKVEEGKLQEFETWVGGHLDLIKDTLRDTLARFEEENNQIEGNMPGADYPYSGAFRVDYPLTKKKCREIANRMKQAYLDSDPIWAATLSGDEKNEMEVALADQIERAMDNAVDNNLEALDDLSRAIFNAVTHGIGAIVPSWEYQEAGRKDFETVKGYDGTTEESLNGILDFEDRYPGWKQNKQLLAIHRGLLAGRDFEGEVSYTEAVRNTPVLTSIEPESLRVYPWVKGHTGLNATPIYGYVQQYRYYELEDMAASGWIDEDALKRLREHAQKESQNPQLQNESFEIFVGTANYDLEGDQGRYKVFYAVEARIMLRVRSFPWWCGEPDLIPFYIRQEEEGFFKRGYAWDLRDDHLIIVVLLNMYLNGIDMANSLRLKAKAGSPAEAQLLSRRWSPQQPLLWKENPNEVDSMATPMNHLSGLIESIQLMLNVSDSSTNTSELQSGRESPRDPNAPASKSALLLQQVEPNTKENIRSLEPAMRKVGRYVLWLYYQGMKLKWIKEIPGAPALTADQIRAVIGNLNPRALMFETDRNEKGQKNATVLGMVAKFAPQAVPRVLKIAIASMSSDWARAVNSLQLEQLPLPGAPTAPPGPIPQPQAGGPRPAMPAQPPAGTAPVPSLNGGRA